MREEYSCSFSVFYWSAKQDLKGKVNSTYMSVLSIETNTRKVKSDDTGILVVSCRSSI